MPIRRINTTIDQVPWYMLRDYLVEAYSNPEMRALVELSLIAEAASRLPDERVPANEYAATLCTLIQRHSGVPSPEFWLQLSEDRPLRQREIGKIRGCFSGAIRADAEARYSQRGPSKAAAWRATISQLLTISVAFVSLVIVSTYFARMPGPNPTPESMQRPGLLMSPELLASPELTPMSTAMAAESSSKSKAWCVNGTRSPSCEADRDDSRGCCSSHGGLATPEQVAMFERGEAGR